MIDAADTSRTAIVTLSALGGSGAGAVVVFFLKEYYSESKRDLKHLTKATTELVTELKALSRDLRKMEGALEGQQKQIIELTKETASLLGNIKALWTSLQNIYPEFVPRRMSDRGG